MMSRSIIIASPHHRNDVTERMARQALPDIEVVRVKSCDELSAALDRAPPEWVFFPHWSWKIPEAIFEAHRCIIFHMTDVPYGRGGSPLQNLILRGHKTTKLSAIRCVAELDAGPVYLKHEIDLSGTAEDILRRVAVKIGEIIPQLVHEEPPAEEQQVEEQESDVVRFERRKPDQSRVPEGLGAEALYDFIRMLDADGYPRANVEAAGCIFELSDAKLADGLVEAKVTIRVKQ